MEERREKNKVLLADDLDVDVLHGIAVQGGDGPRVPDPKIDGIGTLFQGYAGEGDVLLGIGEEGDVLITEIIIL
jgi:hypothetical protein